MMLLREFVRLQKLATDYFLPCMHIFFACDYSSYHQHVGSPALEYGLGHVTCLVSEILANEMEAEA